MIHEFNAVVKSCEIETYDMGRPVVRIEFSGKYGFFWVLPVNEATIKELMRVTEVTELSKIKGCIVRAVSDGTIVRTIKHPIDEIEMTY